MTHPAAALRLAGCIAAILVLGACASQPAARFHTLLPSTAPASAPNPARVPAWELEPVAVPVQVNQPQLVVRNADDSLAVLEQERWIAPLADEIQAALSERLTQSVGRPWGPATWRIRVDVQRFDSVPSRIARLEATWSLNAPPGGELRLSCRSLFEPTVGAGYPALAAGHREAVTRLADAIAAALLALQNKAAAPSC